jgi:ketosteroid isomerase-like protein
VEPQEYIDRGDWVLVPLRGRVRGRQSGVEVEISDTFAVRVEGSRIVRVQEYATTEEALATSQPRE